MLPNIKIVQKISVYADSYRKNFRTIRANQVNMELLCGKDRRNVLYYT